MCPPKRHWQWLDLAKPSAAIHKQYIYNERKAEQSKIADRFASLNLDTQLRNGGV